MSSTNFDIVTADNGFIGNLTGNVTGDLTGNVTGAIISTRAVLAATGSGASTAAVISTQIVAVTDSDGTKAVALPAAATSSAPILVINTVTTAALPVYPVNGGNDNINAGAEDAAWTLGPGKAAWFTATSATQWYVADVSAATATTTELNLIDGSIAGTAVASKALALGANKNVDVLVVADGGLYLGAGAGTAVTATAAEINYLDIATLGTGAASKAVVLDASGDYTFPATATIVMPSGGDMTFASGSTLDVAGTFEIANVAMTASAAELNYNDIATLGTLAASKTWTSDASLDTVMPTGGLLTVQSGAGITFNSGSTHLLDGPVTTTVAATEHGAGSIGTYIAPRTYRWTDRGVIVTQTKVDLTGLASVATANDVIGLAAGGAAYIGRNVEATNGVIFKVEFACLETPLTGDNDVNVVANSSAVLAYDGAGGTTYLSNSGDLLKGQTIQNLVPALTEGDYFYLTAGTGDTAATYTAGMYLLTTYGHAPL